MKFTYYTIIGKSLPLLKGHVENVKYYGGFDKLLCEKEFIIIVYKNKTISPEVTESILEYCKEQNIRTEIYDEPEGKSFIEHLYFCWNRGYEVADEGLVFRAGSDQVFSRDSFVYLYDAYMKLKAEGIENVILQANTIENETALKQIGATSRHFALDLGNSFETFDYNTFEIFIKSINKRAKNELIDIDEALSLWGKPTELMTSLGIIDRCDGCSWLMHKRDFERFGKMIPIDANGITGDVTIHDLMQKAGYIEYIVRDVITYHFVRGESINQY